MSDVSFQRAQASKQSYMMQRMFKITLQSFGFLLAVLRDVSQHRVKSCSVVNKSNWQTANTRSSLRRSMMYRNSTWHFNAIYSSVLRAAYILDEPPELVAVLAVPTPAWPESPVARGEARKTMEVDCGLVMTLRSVDETGDASGEK